MPILWGGGCRANSLAGWAGSGGRDVRHTMWAGSANPSSLPKLGGPLADLPIFEQTLLGEKGGTGQPTADRRSTTEFLVSPALAAEACSLVRGEVVDKPLSQVGG